MESLSKIRNYLVQEIKKIDSDFRAHDDAFNVVNVAGTLLSKSYHITYEVGAVEMGQQMFTQSVPIEVKFYFQGGRDSIDMFDTGMDTVNDIAASLCSRVNVYAFRDADDFPIQGMTFISQIPEEIEDNDNSMTITLSLSAEILKSIC